jgi:phenylacetate-CoA ligase
VYSPNVYVEIVDDQGRNCAPRETGRILITLLTNFAFPLIRYDIGDLGEWAEPASCPCGLSFPRLRCLEGRQDETITTMDGTQLTSVFIRHTVGVSLNRQLVREWRFEQTGRGSYTFTYVPATAEGLDAILRELASVLRKALGSSATIEMRPVVALPIETSGKRRWVINRFASMPQRAASPVDARSEPGNAGC